MDISSDEMSMQWVGTVEDVIQEEVIEELVTTEEVVEEEYQEEIVETMIDGAQGNVEQEIMMVPESNDIEESIYVVSQDQEHDYLDISEVTEEVVADSWDRSGGHDEGLQMQISNVSHESVIDYEGMDMTVPIREQDSYALTRPFPCEFCNKRFSRVAMLENHMIQEHQKPRPTEMLGGDIPCNMCNKRFSRRADWQNHMKTHARRHAEDEELTEAMILERERQERNKGRRKKPASPRKRKSSVTSNRMSQHQVKIEVPRYMSKSYDYAEEEARLVEEMPPEIPEQRFAITDATRPYVCQNCGKSFAREKALQSHARLHVEYGAYECRKCDDIFSDMSALREHNRMRHSEIYQSVESHDFDDIDYQAEQYSAHYCDICGAEFSKIEQLKRHQKSHIKDEESHLIDGLEQRQVCTVCGDQFDSDLALLAHQACHASKTTHHRCLDCGARCRDEEELIEHVRENHPEDENPNMCTNCGKTCKDKRSLLKHATVHSNDKVFTCTKCCKQFHSQTRLRRHMMSHRDKMAVCEECGAKFPDGRALVSHRHSHNKELAGRTFPCKECGKVFGSRSSQQIHTRIHTGEKPYACRFCWKAFADGGTLRKHERIHTGEKPYGCAICPRAFNQRVVLREHVRAHHSGPDPKLQGSMTPFACKVCGTMFPNSEEIVVHIVEHCDANTAMRRQPQNGPRKYKKRSKLKSSRSDVLLPPIRSPPNDPSFDMLLHPSESEDDLKSRKLAKKAKLQPQQQRITLDDGIQSALTGFESVNTIINNLKNVTTSPKSKPQKKTTKKKDDKINELPSTSQSGRPKMIYTQKTRVPVEIGTEGVKKGQKTKTLVTRTRVTPSEHKYNTFPGGERNRPRTKNVNYHVEGKLHNLALATFPLIREEPSISRDTSFSTSMSNIKMEPELPRQFMNNTNNDHGINNGNVISEKTLKSPRGRKKKPELTKNKRNVKVLVKEEPREHEICMEEVLGEEIPDNNNVEEETIPVESSHVFEEVVDGNDMEVAFEANVTTEESILPEIAPVKLMRSHRRRDDLAKHSNISNDEMEQLDYQQDVEIPETILPDPVVEYTCEMCSEIFCSRPELLLHVHTHI